MRHALRLELDHQADAIFGNALVVESPVDPGGGVALGACFLELAIEAARLVLLGLVEHQMLEEVSEPGFAHLLVPRSDGEPRVVARDRCARIDAEQHGEPVAETVLLDLHRGTEEEGPLMFDLGARRLAVVERAEHLRARIALGFFLADLLAWLRQSVLPAFGSTATWRRRNRQTAAPTRLSAKRPAALLEP